MTLFNIAAVAIGGGAGAVVRYLCQTTLPATPLGLSTVMVNISGSLLIGISWTLLRHYAPSAVWSLLLVTGFLGGFTTFSTFTLDAFKLIERGEVLQSVIYIAVTVIVSLIACASSIAVTNRLLS